MSDISDRNAKKIINHINKYSSSNSQYLISGSEFSDYGIYVYTEHYLYAFPSISPITKRFNDGGGFNNSKVHNKVLYDNYLRNTTPRVPFLCPCVHKLNIDRYFEKAVVSDDYGYRVFNGRYDGQIQKKEGLEFISFYIKEKYIDVKTNWVDIEYELYELYTKVYHRKGHMNRYKPDDSKAHAINALIHPDQINLLYKLYPQLK